MSLKSWLITLAFIDGDNSRRKRSNSFCDSRDDWFVKINSRVRSVNFSGSFRLPIAVFT